MRIVFISCLSERMLTHKVYLSCCSSYMMRCENILIYRKFYKSSDLSEVDVKSHYSHHFKPLSLRVLKEQRACLTSSLSETRSCCAYEVMYHSWLNKWFCQSLSLKKRCFFKIAVLRSLQYTISVITDCLFFVVSSLFFIHLVTVKQLCSGIILTSLLSSMWESIYTFLFWVQSKIQMTQDVMTV